MDWAVHTVTVATQKSDAAGASVFIDGGICVWITPASAAGFVQNGGPAASRLTITANGGLMVSGDYVQMPNGTLAIGIGGIGSPHDSAQLRCGRRGRARRHAQARAGGRVRAVGRRFV